MRVLITSILLAFLLAACGKGQETPKSKEMGMEPSSEAAPMAAAETNGMTVDGTFYPDHSKDLQEFHIRSSLSGVERMIEQYKKDGYDTSELESQKAELEKQLANLTG